MKTSNNTKRHKPFVLVGLIQLVIGKWSVWRGKRALIARVIERLDAPPEWVPNTRRWPELSAAQNAYKRVLFAGKFDYDKRDLLVCGRLSR